MADLNALTPASFLLLPALADKLEVWTEGDPDRSIILGICRRAWIQNQVHLRAFGPVTEIVTATTGTAPTLIGPASWLRYWPAKSARPLSGLDLLVDAEQMRPLLTAFHGARWSASGAPEARSLQSIRFGPPIILRSDSGASVRLYSRALPNTDLSLLRQPSAPQVTLDDLTTVPAEYAFVAALTQHHEDGFDWRADAGTILKSCRLDWSLVSDLTRHRSLARQRTNELQRYSDTPIPPLSCPPAWLETVETTLAAVLRTYRNAARRSTSWPGGT